MGQLDGRVAVVTGGNGGIGLGLAEALLDAELRIARVDDRDRIALGPRGAHGRGRGGGREHHGEERGLGTGTHHPVP